MTKPAEPGVYIDPQKIAVALRRAVGCDLRAPLGKGRIMAWLETEGVKVIRRAIAEMGQEVEAIEVKMGNLPTKPPK